MRNQRDLKEIYDVTESIFLLESDSRGDEPNTFGDERPVASMLDSSESKNPKAKEKKKEKKQNTPTHASL